jgi:hypothetical protein
MEDRIIIAGLLIAVMLAVVGWILISKMSERRRFKERQLGRGKNNERNMLEPAE